MNEAPLIKLYDAAAIEKAVLRLSSEIDADAAGRPLVLVGVMSGVFMFIADLARALASAAEVSFMEIASYGTGTVPGELSMSSSPPPALVSGRDVIVVDDIVDTGRTARFALECLGKHDPSSLRLCALLDKPCRREQEVKIDYRGFTVGDRFVVGYGMDHAGNYRQLKGIYAIEEERGDGSPPG